MKYNILKKRVKKILITAGGTIVKIDDVRHIGNFSTGSFPSKIAAAALRRGHNVFYLHSVRAKTPPTHRNLVCIGFETYDDYATELKNVLQKNKIDIAFLAAAVSDYGVKSIKGKISSSSESFALRLFRLPKIIMFVKKWSSTPVFQVGFKLLSGVSDKKLIECAYESGLASHSDLTIATDLAKLRSGERESVIVTPEKGAIRFAGADVAKNVLAFAEKRERVTHFKTVVKKNAMFAVAYGKEIKLFTKLCGLLARTGHMPDYFEGSQSGHGSLALRISARSFLITARSSNKKHLRKDDVVLVREVDWKNKKIMVSTQSGKKASLNAVLVARILEKFPKVNAVVHTHRFVADAPTTSFPCTPGTLEYASLPIVLLKKSRLINLKDHGLIAIGKDLEETTRYVLG